MIYLVWGDQQVVVLEPSEIERMKLGDVIRTPNDKVFFAYTPDLMWLAKQIDMATISPDKLDELLKLGRKRPEILTSSGPLRNLVKP